MVQGRGVDASINENGKQQAKKAGERLSSIMFDQVFTSELIRTKETVGQFIHNGTPITSHEGFDEISWGNQEGVVASLEARNLYAETVKEWREGNLHLNVGGGESPIEVMNRQKEAMEVVMASEGENILICMHGREIGRASC